MVDPSYTDERIQVLTPSSSTLIGKPYNLHKTHLWLKDSSNTFAAQLMLGELATIPDFFEAIREAFVAQNPDHKIQIENKGDVERIKILLWGMGVNGDSILKTINEFSCRTTQAVFERFRLALATAFKKYRHEDYGEVLLCLCTVSFESD
jgi:hypothetical protein